MTAREKTRQHIKTRLQSCALEPGDLLYCGLLCCLAASVSRGGRNGRVSLYGSGETFPCNAVDLFHNFADFVHHVLACFALSRELHEADLILLLAEIDFPAVLPVLAEADPASVRAALEVI